MRPTEGAHWPPWVPARTTPTGLRPRRTTGLVPHNVEAEAAVLGTMLQLGVYGRPPARWRWPGCAPRTSTPRPRAGVRGRSPVSSTPAILPTLVWSSTSCAATDWPTRSAIPPPWWCRCWPGRRPPRGAVRWVQIVAELADQRREQAAALELAHGRRRRRRGRPTDGPGRTWNDSPREARGGGGPDRSRPPPVEAVLADLLEDFAHPERGGGRHRDRQPGPDAGRGRVAAGAVLVGGRTRGGQERLRPAELPASSRGRPGGVVRVGRAVPQRTGGADLLPGTASPHRQPTGTATRPWPRGCGNGPARSTWPACTSKKTPTWSARTSRARWAGCGAGPQSCREAGQRPLVVVDYLQRLRPAEGDRRLDERLRVSMACLGLRQLARDLEVPVLAISSVGRTSYPASPPWTGTKAPGTWNTTPTAACCSNPETTPDRPARTAAIPVELHIMKSRYGELTFDHPIALALRPPLRHLPRNHSPNRRPPPPHHAWPQSAK